jgi:hypothetical protein
VILAGWLAGSTTPAIFIGCPRDYGGAVMAGGRTGEKEGYRLFVSIGFMQRTAWTLKKARGEGFLNGLDPTPSH